MVSPPAHPPAPAYPLGPVAKLRLLGRIWATAVAVVMGLRRERLPALIARLGAPATSAADARSAEAHPPLPPALLSRAVSRGLRLGPWQPRCLVRALVLYRLLRAQGEESVLVIGLDAVRPTTEAHAWVELDGRDIGPVPGAFGHRALVRYPIDGVEDDRDA
jgi:hypothetical protein